MCIRDRIYAGASSAGTTLSVWSPQLLKSFHLDNLTTGLLNAIPYGLASVLMIVWGRSSDRNNERRWHTALALFMIAAGVFAAFINLSLPATIMILSTIPVSYTHLGLVVTNTLYHGVYFSELLYQVARMTEDKGRQLILADGKHSAQEEREAIQYLLDLRCDAIIIYPRFLTVDEMDEIVENHSQPIMVLKDRKSVV